MGGPGAQGCSTRQAEAPGAQPQPLLCPGDSWEHQEQGSWGHGHGALAFEQRNPAVSRGTSSSLCPTLLAIPCFGSVSLGVSRAAGPSWGRSQQLLPSEGCFAALLVAVLPRCWWGDPSECLVFAVCSSQSSVCSVPPAILCCYQQHLNLPNCCKPPLQH